MFLLSTTLGEFTFSSASKPLSAVKGFTKVAICVDGSSKQVAIDEGNKLTFSVPEVQLSYNGPTVDGPTGIKMDQSFSAYFNDNADNASVVVTLVNDVESY